METPHEEDSPRTAPTPKAPSESTPAPAPASRSRALWALLLARIYEVLPLLCPAEWLEESSSGSPMLANQGRFIRYLLLLLGGDGEELREALGLFRYRATARRTRPWRTSSSWRR